MSEVNRPVPQPTQLTEPYWNAANDERLVVQCCRACAHRQFFPRPFCLKCESDQIDWQEVSGRGTVYTFTINYRAPNAAMKERLPYAVALIDLEEGVRMMANIVNSDFADIAIGSAVKVVFEKISDHITLPQFELTS
jgi:uncharacterized OB-fold protein